MPFIELFQKFIKLLFRYFTGFIFPFQNQTFVLVPVVAQRAGEGDRVARGEALAVLGAVGRSYPERSSAIYHLFRVDQAYANRAALSGHA